MPKKSGQYNTLDKMRPKRGDDRICGTVEASEVLLVFIVLSLRQILMFDFE
jgi:hypothetical protein